MQNLKIYLPLVDGSRFQVEFKNGKELIEKLIGDDFAAPPTKLYIEGTTTDGMPVRISVPYDDSDIAHVQGI